MKEGDRKPPESGLYVGKSVAVLEHQKCAGTTGTVTDIKDGAPEVRCDRCKQRVYIDHRH